MNVRVEPAAASTALWWGAVAMLATCAPRHACASAPIDSAAAFGIVSGAGVSDPAAAGMPIRKIEIRTHDIYDPIPSGRLARAYRLANRLHVKTRTHTVRELLLFSPGEPWNPARGQETERILRSLDILASARVTAARFGDSVDVWVETDDAWTTTPEFNLESGGGELFGSVSFVERNLFGLGKSIGIAYREDPTGISRSGSFVDPNVLATRMRIAFMAGTGSQGATNSLDVGVPFYAEDARTSYGVRWRKATSIARLFQAGSEVADFDHRLEETELYLGFGRRVDGTIVRLTGSFLVRDRRFGPTRMQPEAPEDFAGPEDNLRLHRFATELQLWRPHPIERMHVNQLDGIEDFDLGPSFTTVAGVAPRFLGSTADEGYGRMQLSGGVMTGARSFGLIEVDLSSRFRSRPRESIARVDARWNDQSIPRQTLVLSATGVAGTRVSRDFQTVIGGLNGLRAYPVHALAGNQVWRFNAESRWFVVNDYFQLASLGAAAFYDAARAWGPGSADAGWHHGVGFGLRVALPHSSLNRVARFDVAFPIKPSRDGRHEPVFSFGSSQAF